MSSKEEELVKEKETKLVFEALKARRHSYAPYSRFSVGAALLTCGGEIFTGCNVENASFGLTICAEQVAVVKAVSCGKRAFEALAVGARSTDYCVPCGACRQILAEFNPRLKIIMANEDADYQVRTLNELLPEAFTKT